MNNNAKTPSENSNQVRKILYRSLHRGCKETDFLLGNFFEANQNNLIEFDLNLCENFLQEDDWEIYDWILSKVATPSQYQKLISAIQKFHQIL
ncbi:MAG: succinate dehydrogenase assembly factor 2 [Alphaproteobacteria bacterium]